VFPAPALGLVNRVQQFLIIQKLVGLPHPRLPQILDFLSPKSSPEASLPVPQLDHAYPEAVDETRRIYPDQDGLTLCDSAGAALQGADALAILTEWQQFRSPNFDTIATTLSDKVIFDGRNLYEPATVEAHGIQYYAIGRGRT
jgi:hypothetical protein